MVSRWHFDDNARSVSFIVDGVQTVPGVEGAQQWVGYTHCSEPSRHAHLFTQILYAVQPTRL